SYELNIFQLAEPKQIKPAVERVDFDRPRVRWKRDGSHFTYEKIDRGHQRFRLIDVAVDTGSARELIDEKSETFIWTAHRDRMNWSLITWLDSSDELFYMSERDGWRRLYLVDCRDGTIKNAVTPGQCVLRGIDRIDEGNRQLWFQASGKVPGQDPYF